MDATRPPREASEMTAVATFPDTLRRWRTARRMSQLDLALASDISTRHLSFLETGRARPSRDMVLKLGEALLAPRAAQNELLRAAGFAPLFPATPLDDDALGPFRVVLSEMMARHDPWPAMLCDRHWTIRDANASARRLLAPLHGEAGEMNIIRMLTQAPLARTLIANWPEVIHEMAARIRLEALEAGYDPVLNALLDDLDRAVAGLGPRPSTSHRQPLAPVILQSGEGRLSFLSTVAHFGTSEDITIRDLRLELLFPADDATKRALMAMG
jgi:transcriptional regulator with XRE-family HTH domain